MGFVLSKETCLSAQNFSAEEATMLVLTVQSSPTATCPQTFISLTFTLPSLVRDTRLMNIHGDADYDIQFIFSYLPYLEEASGPVLEVSVVVVQRRDVEEDGKGTR